MARYSRHLLGTALTVSSVAVGVVAFSGCTVTNTVIVGEGEAAVDAASSSPSGDGPQMAPRIEVPDER